MTTATRSRFLSLLRDADNGLHDDLAALVARIRAYLLNAADADGHLPLVRQEQAQKQIAAVLLSYFLDSSGHGYAVSTNGTLVATSPYMRRLWNAVTDATQMGVREQADALRAALNGHPDLVRKLETAQTNPFLAFDLLGDDEDLFAGYVPPQNITWDDGRILQDRVLMAAATTRQRGGMLVRQLLSENRTAKEVSDALSDYFAGKGTRAGLVNGAFDASRLLMSSISYSYQQAKRMSAALDPFVTQIDWVLSPSHRVADECDDLAAGSPYSIKSLPPFPAHAGCLCDLVIHSQSSSAAVETLRRSPLLNVRGALAPGFAELLLKGQRE